MKDVTDTEIDSYNTDMAEEESSSAELYDIEEGEELNFNHQPVSDPEDDYGY
jgi:hypothetical protein